MKPSLASFAQYFRIGLEVGICEPEEARDWAIAVIVEDGLYLAQTPTYGTIAACREDFDKALKEYGTPPFSLPKV